MLPLTKLQRLFASYPEIDAVYLFGSRARGTEHHGSDIDLAVVPASPGMRQRKLDLLADLTRLGLDRIDLVILDSTDIVLRFEAVHCNRLIYAQPGFDRGSYFSDAIRKYFDFLPHLAVQRKALKLRILGREG